MTVKGIRELLENYNDDSEVYINCIGDKDVSTIEDYYTDSWDNPVLKVNRVAPLLAQIRVIMRTIGGDETTVKELERVLANYIDDTGSLFDAIEKQVAWPIVIDEYKRVKCPRGHNLPVMCREKQLSYCPFCGQKIDWRKQNGSN